MTKLNELFLLSILFCVLCNVGMITPVLLTQPADIDFSYMKFVYNATELPLEETYDYIVVGGGTTGCPLAATLSEKYKVLVLERGGTPSQHPSVLSADSFATTLLEADTYQDSPAQEFVSEDGVKLARGRILGGSSMINGAFYSRSDPGFYTEYGVQFDMNLVKESYEWVEERIVSTCALQLWQAAVRGALLESGFDPDNGVTYDHLEGTKTSFSTFDCAGKRHGSVELLNMANFVNIKIGVHATVVKIIFSSSSSSSPSGLAAVGVIYKDSKGRLHKALVRGKGEVILSAGTLGSPQLLLLSGVGPKSQLKSMNIPVVYDSPYVGQYLQDMPRNDIYIELPFPSPSTAQIVGIKTNFTYIEALSASVSFYFPTKSGIFSPSNVPSTVDVGYILGKAAKVYSRGFLRLASTTNVSANPIVRFNYFQEPNDLQNCVAKIRAMIDLFKTKSMEIFKLQDGNGMRYFKFLGQPLPSNLFDETALASYCRTTLTTIYHYHGGCLVGSVVDENLKVKGIKALRVVDFSTSAGSPGTNPQSTLMMLGRYMGVKIVEGRATN